jgi:hypothetical protein
MGHLQHRAGVTGKPPQFPNVKFPRFHLQWLKSGNVVGKPKNGKTMATVQQFGKKQPTNPNAVT